MFGKSNIKRKQKQIKQQLKQKKEGALPQHKKYNKCNHPKPCHTDRLKFSGNTLSSFFNSQQKTKRQERDNLGKNYQSGEERKKKRKRTNCTKTNKKKTQGKLTKWFVNKLFLLLLFVFVFYVCLNQTFCLFCFAVI